jgi:hypothetical protein
MGTPLDAGLWCKWCWFRRVVVCLVLAALWFVWLVGVDVSVGMVAIAGAWVEDRCSCGAANARGE